MYDLVKYFALISAVVSLSAYVGAVGYYLGCKTADFIENKYFK